ncbi:hypothetical protein MSZK_01720 [Mycobacterium sp. shizuoka-1]|nr:hypothetical protein MSZK_01720 [Mycobacterium sp. shizuoka-1]
MDVIDVTRIIPGRLALILLAAGLFAVLTIMAVEINSAWMTALDSSVWDWFNAHRTPQKHGHSAELFIYIGRPVHVAIAGLVSGALLAAAARSITRLVVVTGTVGMGALIEQTFKLLVERTPESLSTLRDGSTLDWPELDHYVHSFPSGHVTGSATLLGTIAVCLAAGRSRAVKLAFAIPAVLGVVFVGCLALYVRAHVFTDVVGGMVLGGALVALSAAVVVKTSRRERRSPAVAVAARP